MTETSSKAPKATKKADGDAEVRAKIAAMPAPYSAMGERLHALIVRSVPALSRECGMACRGTQRMARSSASSAWMMDT